MSGYSQQECFLKALDVCPTDWQSWSGLAKTVPENDTVTATCVANFGAGVVARKPRTRAQCWVEAVSRNSSSSELWCDLGKSIPLGKTEDMPLVGKCNRQYCCLQALTYQPENGEAWLLLADTIDPSLLPVVMKDHVTKSDCLVKAILYRAPNLSRIWSSLGTTLRESKQSTMTHGKRVSAVDCFATALEIEPQVVPPW